VEEGDRYATDEEVRELAIEAAKRWKTLLDRLAKDD
jgi:hypothetical protein